MTVIEMKLEVSLPVLLKGVEQLSTPELENFVAEVLSIQAKRRAPSLSKEESILLQKINQGLPVATQQRFDDLNEKRRDETLTDEEHQ
ncbi:MAG: STAS/SEC14 domain-containing protein, partial [Caldilineaceae bacterium]